MTAFLSYNQTQRGLARALLSRLESVGLDVSVGVRDLPPDELCPENTENAIRRADSVIFLIGPQDETDRSQKVEWRAAVEAAWDDPDKRLIPVLLEGGVLPAFLRSAEPEHGMRYIRVGRCQDLDLATTARAIKKLATGGESRNGTRARDFAPASSPAPEDSLIFTDRTDHRAAMQARFEQIEAFAQEMRLAS